MSHGFPRPLNNSIAVGGADFITLPYGRRSPGTRRKAKVKTFLPLSWGSAAVGATLVVARGWAATRAAPTQNNCPTHSFWIDTVVGCACAPVFVPDLRCAERTLLPGCLPEPVLSEVEGRA